MGIRYQKKPINRQILINQPNSLGNKDSEWELEIYLILNRYSSPTILQTKFGFIRRLFCQFQTVIQVC